MPERTDPSALPAVANDRGGTAYLAAHIRLGQMLLERFGMRRDDEANEAYRAWQDRSRELVRFALISDELYDAHLRGAYRRMCLRHVTHPTEPWRQVELDLRDLESVVQRLETPAVDFARIDEVERDGKVLVVHGRNHEMREQVARFLMKLQLEPILLDEQAAHGRTLIEKLESQAGLSFAVVILTGDDVGALAADRDALHPRARQNVIFELGFAVGRLRRERVCALYEEAVELPSDIHGVEYTPLDPAGAWRAKLARELHEAGFRFDPLKVIN
ncbi:MAG TPA: TIR domain-containing protein [Candidatus Binatia bacterium]|nr:TIR domain-containing protein [Candidatus Binatia bacterium]